MRPTEKTTLFGALLAVAACSGEPASREADAPLDGVPHTAAGATIIPTTGATEYETFTKQANEAVLVRSPADDLALAYRARDGATVVTGGLKRKAQPDTLVLAGGKPSVRADLPTGMVDLLELLPPANAKLILGEPYDSPPPDEDYILQHADHDRLVLWQQMINTPAAVIEGDRFTFVRIENRAMNRLYFVDDDGSIKGRDLGEAYLGLTDLVKVEGGGWEVLRFARFGDVAGADAHPGLDFDQARDRAHAAFVVCATRMDNLGPAALRQAHHQLRDETPEFVVCGAR